MDNLKQFSALSEWLRDALNPGEEFSLGYSAESSEFIRFNQARCARPATCSRPA